MKRHCPEHGTVNAMFKLDKKYGKSYPYCPYCNRLNHKTWCLFRGGYERGRKRAKAWYQANSERKKAYMRDYRRKIRSAVPVAL